MHYTSNLKETKHIKYALNNLLELLAIIPLQNAHDLRVLLHFINTLSFVESTFGLE